MELSRDALRQSNLDARSVAACALAFGGKIS
jgi:hypothetical protein